MTSMKASLVRVLRTGGGGGDWPVRANDLTAVEGVEERFVFNSSENLTTADIDPPDPGPRPGAPHLTSCQTNTVLT